MIPMIHRIHRIQRKAHLAREGFERPAFRSGVLAEAAPRLKPGRLGVRIPRDSEGWGVDSLRLHKAGGLNPSGSTSEMPVSLDSTAPATHTTTWRREANAQLAETKED